MRPIAPAATLSSFCAPSPEAIGEDEREFWRVWSTRHEHLRECCQRWLPDSPADVDEIMSAGALRAVEYLRAHPRSVRRLVPWISRILYHLCVDRMHERARVVPFEGEGFGLRQGPVLWNRDAPETPEGGMQRRQLGGSLHRALCTLSPTLRSTFVLRFVEGLSYPEISARQGITQHSARKRIQKARLRLRRALGGAMRGAGEGGRRGRTAPARRRRG